MRKEIIVLFAFMFLMSFVGLVSFACAADIPQYQDKYVNDFAGIFDAGQVDGLRGMLYTLEQNTSDQVAVVSIADCGLDYDGYAQQLATKWGIGQKDVSNGLLILYCQAQNKLDVKTGYGLEGMLPDSKIGRYLDDYYVPQRDNGNVAQGIIDFTQQMDLILINSGEYAPNNNASSPVLPVIIFFAVAAVIVAFIVIGYKRNKKELLKNKGTKISGDISLLKNTGKSIFETFLFIVFFIIIFASNNFLVTIGLIILYFAISAFISSRRKCPKCKEKLEKYTSDDAYDYWKCKNGHKFKTLKNQGRNGVFIGGGGFGGGSSGGFGGGSFGGGGFGGGGASR